MGSFFKPPKCSEISVSKCRFGFPRFPQPVTKILVPIKEGELTKEAMQNAEKNLVSIKKFIIRQTTANQDDDGSTLSRKERFFGLSFEQFVDHLNLSEAEYDLALQTTIKGKAGIFVKRKTNAVFVNNYNRKLMIHHNANQDVSVIIDEYQVAAYMIGYITKNECGTSLLLSKLDEETSKQGISFSEKLRKFSKALDTTRSPYKRLHIDYWVCQLLHQQEELSTFLPMIMFIEMDY